jgi:hypothetical protein
MHSPSVCPYQERRCRADLSSPPANVFDGPSADAARLPKRRNFIKLRRPIRGGDDGPTYGVVQNRRMPARSMPIISTRMSRSQKGFPACGNTKSAKARSPRPRGPPAFIWLPPCISTISPRSRRRSQARKVRPPLPTCSNSPPAASTCTCSTTPRSERLRRAGPVIPGRAFSCEPGTQRCNR